MVVRSIGEQECSTTSHRKVKHAIYHKSTSSEEDLKRVFKTPTFKPGKVDIAVLDIPIVPERDVTLVLEVRGKMTFGSDPVLSSPGLKINVEDMFVGNKMMKKASDVEVRDGAGCRVVVDVEAEDTVKYV